MSIIYAVLERGERVQEIIQSRTRCSVWICTYTPDHGKMTIWEVPE